MRRVGFWPAALAIALASGAALAGPARVQQMELSAEGRETRLVLRLNEPSAYRMFTLSAPDRVVLDVTTARLATSALPLPTGAGIIRQVRAANRPDGSVRIVLDLAGRAEPQGIMRRASGAAASEIVVALRAGSPATAAPITTAEAFPQPVPAEASLPLPSTLVPPAEPAPGALAADTSPPASAPDVPDAARPATAPLAAVDIGDRAEPGPAAPVGRDVVIAVDAGHGGKDPGAHGPKGVLEKDVTLRIARRLVEVINAEPGMRAVLTRSRDEFVPLRGRMERARAAKADLFVSIHADAVRNRAVRGASVYVLNEKGATDEAARRLAARENAADLIGGVSLGDKDRTLASVLLDLSQNAALSSSIEVADAILGELSRVGTVRKTRVMQAPFMVLKSPDVPSVLVETAYISNPDEERRLDSHAYRSRIAQAVFAGVRDYFYRNPPRGTLVAELSRQRFAQGARHEFKRGESLSGIATRYKTSVRRIREANGLKGDDVPVGRVLRIPATRET
jgi:N-acetylmuramoyl-L-alanine amidase